MICFINCFNVEMLSSTYTLIHDLKFLLALSSIKSSFGVNKCIYNNEVVKITHFILWILWYVKQHSFNNESTFYPSTSKYRITLLYNKNIQNITRRLTAKTNYTLIYLQIAITTQIPQLLFWRTGEKRNFKKLINKSNI